MVYAVPGFVQVTKWVFLSCLALKVSGADFSGLAEASQDVARSSCRIGFSIAPAGFPDKQRSRHRCQLLFPSGVVAPTLPYQRCQPKTAPSLVPITLPSSYFSNS